MQVEGQHDVSLLTLMATGARVSNAYPTCPAPGDNLPKGRLIPDAQMLPHGGIWKAPAVREGGASH